MTEIEKIRVDQLQTEIHKRIPEFGVVISGLMYFDFGTDVSWSIGLKKYKSRIETRLVQEYCFYHNIPLVDIVQKESSYNKLIEVLADILEHAIRSHLNRWKS